MQSFEFGPSRKPGDDVELSEELGNDFAGILTAAEELDLFHDAEERIFGLGDGDLGVVLPLPVKRASMFE
jgi:hypothetical protein